MIGVGSSAGGPISVSAGAPAVVVVTVHKAKLYSAHLCVFGATFLSSSSANFLPRGSAACVHATPPLDVCAVHRAATTGALSANAGPSTSTAPGNDPSSDRPTGDSLLGAADAVAFSTPLRTATEQEAPRRRRGDRRLKAQERARAKLAAEPTPAEPNVLTFEVHEVCAQLFF